MKIENILEWIIILTIIAAGTFLFLWAYDFDIKCLLVNCVRIK